MEKDWVKIYAHSQHYNVGLVKAVLFDNGIDSVIVNKKDNAYLFGEVELYTHVDNAFEAKQIIEKNKL